MIVIILGKSGTGKGCITANLLKEHPEYIPWLMHTTRNPRPGEVDGVDYFFTDPIDLHQMQERDEMLYTQTFQKTDGFVTYSTRIIPPGRARKCDYILKDQNPESAKMIKKYYADKKVKVVCVLLQTEDSIRRERILQRGGETKEEMERRWDAKDGDRQYDEENIKDLIDYQFHNRYFEDIETITACISNIIIVSDKGII